MFGEIGLDRGDERAYRVLVRAGQVHARDLAELLGVAEPEARRRLDTLVNAGLVTSSNNGGPAAGVEPAESGHIFRPVSPDVALGAELQRRQEMLETARREIAQLTEEYLAAARRHDAGQLVEIVSGRTELRQRLRHLQDTAQEEVQWFCRANHVAMASSENTEEFDALARGVRYRVIYERALIEEPGMIKSLTDGIAAGEEARSLPILPVRLAIADRSVAVCPLVPDGRSGEPTAAVVSGSQLLDALLALFDSYWEQASPVVVTGKGNDAEPHVNQPGADEHLLLSLLVAGVPDKAIASQLGLSRRTVQRRIVDLMALAGVDTRPGLAYQAARRGWV
jgi:sugar-specific transcriptional regulator TrmB/DNA-binding CsgD family transcriptional regulator